MATKALTRDIPPPRSRPLVGGLRGADTSAGRKDQEKFGWDELGRYEVKGSWRSWGLEKGSDEVDFMRSLVNSGTEGVSRLDSRWDNTWAGDRDAK
jgi:hypothetical protein